MKIKEEAEDFKVSENNNLVPKKEGNYTYFWLNKKNWNTTKAIKKISRKARVSIKRFGWAGNKDKHAITKQLVSAWKIDPDILENIKLKDIEIKVIGKGEKRINLGDLEGNHFNILVRDVDSKKIDELKKQIELIKDEGFPNYFGEQRFGRGNTHLIGKELIKGRAQRAVKLIITYQSEENPESSKARKYAENHWEEWSKIIKKMPKWFHIEKAILNHLIKNQNDFAGAVRKLPKKTLKLYVHAYQSYIFNSILSSLLKNKKSEKIKLSKWKFYFPTSKIKLPEKVELIGYKSKIDDEYSEIVKEIFEKEKVKLEDFMCKRIPELKTEGNLRNSMSQISKIEIIKISDDELNKGKKKIRIKFNLPKGSYATVLLRSLFLEGSK